MGSFSRAGEKTTSNQIVANNMNKEGIFEWIVSYDTIKEYFSSSFIPSVVNSEPSSVNALVIGCGTSTLNESIAQDYNFKVTAIDNDEDCVIHMKTLFPDSSVCYECYDIVERQSPTIPPATVASSSCNNSFDLIVDKGTLDAILVEGSITTMIIDIIRLLKVNGYYMLFTINEIDLLTDVFTYSALPFTITYANPLKTAKVTTLENGMKKTVGGNVMIFQKTAYPISFNQAIYEQEAFVIKLRAHEDEIMDEYFQTNTPLLTPEFESHIRTEFGLLQPANIANFPDAHRILFGKFHTSLGYDHTLFCEDLQTFDLNEREQITLDEAIRFIQQMQ